MESLPPFVPVTWPSPLQLPPCSCAEARPVIFPPKHQPRSLKLRRVALGIAGGTLTIVDTCQKSGDAAEAAAKTRGKVAN